MSFFVSLESPIAHHDVYHESDDHEINENLPDVQPVSTETNDEAAENDAATRSVPRHYLVGIELFNFKSFRGEHVIGPLSTLTGVVGPNGSGKSNLMDAISFALCGNLCSNLRTKKIAELVSKNRAPFDVSHDRRFPHNRSCKAFVRLIFAPRESSSASSEIIANITLTRFISSNDTSRYAIDDAECNRTQYLDALTSLGLNSKDMIFMLFQNRIDNLITKNPKDFTKILEKIAGSDQLEAQYNEQKKQEEALRSQLITLSNQRRISMNARRMLLSLKRKKFQTDTIFRDIARLKLRIVLLRLRQSDLELRRISDRIAEIADQRPELDSTIRDLKRCADDAAKRCKQSNDRLSEHMKRWRAFELSVTCGSGMTYKSAKEKQRHAAKRIKSIEAIVAKEMNKRNEINTKIDDLRQQILMLEADLEAQTRRRDEARRHACETLISEEQISEYNRLKQRFEERVRSNEEFNEQERQLEIREQERNIAQTKLLGIEQKIDSIRSEIDESEMQRRIETEIDAGVERDLVKAKAEQTRSREEIEQSKTKIIVLEKAIQQSTSMMNELYADVEREREKRNNDKLINHLRRTYGEMRVFGRFATLFSVSNQRYSAAFVAVCASKLDAIVVDSNATLRSIYKHESRNQLRSQIFLALDTVVAPTIEAKLRHITKYDGADEDDASHQLRPRLLCDEIRLRSSAARRKVALEKVLQFVVGNTLVCANREIAADAAYSLGTGKYYNTVSIDGTRFSKYGVISASFDRGASSKRSNGTGTGAITATLVDIEQYDAEVAKLEALRRDLLDERRALHDAIKRAETIQMEIYGLNEKFERSKRSIAKLNNANRQLTRLEAGRDELRESLRALTNDHIDPAVRRIKAAQAEHENAIFGDFLAQFQAENIASIADFEATLARTFNGNDDGGGEHGHEMEWRRSAESEIRLAHLRSEVETILADRQTECEESIARWRREEAQWRAELSSADRAIVEAENRFAQDREQSASLRTEIDQLEAEYRRLAKEANAARDELRAEMDRREIASQRAANLEAKRDETAKIRHNTLQQAYMDGIDVPLIDDDAYPDTIETIFAESITENEAIERERRLQIDFRDIGDIDFESNDREDGDGDDDRFRSIIHELEIELKRKSEDADNLGMQPSTDIDQRLNEIGRELSAQARTLKSVRDRQNEARIAFNRTKSERRRQFGRFLERTRSQLTEYYRQLTGAPQSQAFLLPENEDEPYLGGVQYSCIPNRKMFQSISALSGGEKCLAALALVYACYAHRLPCFFVMDEIDGALDNANTFKLMNFLRDKQAQTQFILITHNQELYGRTNSLVGVCRERIDENDRSGAEENDENSNIDTTDANRNFQSKTYSLDLTQFEDDDVNENSI